MEIAVIGNSEFILGFRLAGIRKTYSAENDEKFTEFITKVLHDSSVGILVLKSSDQVFYIDLQLISPAQTNLS